ncbi:MAG: hypothetical protein ACRDHX_14085 [Chloroflexota bacterium]
MPPRQNRVTPWGTIVADSGRGLFFGNRGNLHNRGETIVRPWKSRAWVTCLLRFKGRRRQLLQPGRYTELFFLDEATALAAGHRPCGECRRHDLEHFKQTWAVAVGAQDTLADIDRRLHLDRVGPDKGQRTFAAVCAGLPDGTYIERAGAAWLVHDQALHRWSPAGYVEQAVPRPAETVHVLTPRCTVAVLSAGYRPVLHPTAQGPVA